MFLKKQITLILLFLLCSNIFWAQSIPPKIIAAGKQSYCPLSQLPIVTSFDILNPDNTEIKEFYIQISTGYIRGEDVLKLKGVHANIEASWDVSQGKLTLQVKNLGVSSDSDLIAAVKEVVFESNSLQVSGEKYFSLTLGEANYLPATGHYYQYVENIGITWTEAKTAAEALSYYGIQGYLATITSMEEAVLSGEQAGGAGWIGGSDAAVEGTWKWVTGPEAGTVFWNGLANGSSPTGQFAFWNNNEPNNLGNEDYAHITAPGVGIAGSWNDLSNTGEASGNYQPKGYIVEYGGSPGDPILDLSESTNLYIPSVELIDNVEVCGPQAVTLTAQASHGSVMWFETIDQDTPIHIGELFTSPELLTSTTYYVLASENGCTEGVRKPLQVTVYETPVIVPEAELQNCDEDGNPDGYTNFNLTNVIELITYGDTTLSVSFHLSSLDAASGANPVVASPFNNSTADIVYARIENNDGCYDISKITLKAIVTSLPDDLIVNLEECDMDDSNDGYYTFDLTTASVEILEHFDDQDLRIFYFRNLSDAQLQQNAIDPLLPYVNEIQNTQTLYIRIESNGNCFGIGPHVTLNVLPLPEFDVNKEEILCLNEGTTVLQIYNPSGTYAYEWMDESGAVLGVDSQLTVTSGGVYTVVATSDVQCSSEPRKIHVTESDMATLTNEDIVILDGAENNTIKILTANHHLGAGNYEFALDSAFGPYQEEPVFENVMPGIHTIYARDIHQCGISSIEISVIGFPKFFTPNNDGVNDFWQVYGVSFQPNSKIFIYDKFGKLLKKIDANGLGWDGSYNNRVLPSSDYWYVVELEDGRVYKGHFSLIRR